MSTSDPFLPIQFSDAEDDVTAAAEPGLSGLDTEQAPDVLVEPETGESEDPATDRDIPFQTPTGRSVDPADD